MHVSYGPGLAALRSDMDTYWKLFPLEQIEAEVEAIIKLAALDRFEKNVQFFPIL